MSMTQRRIQWTAWELALFVGLTLGLMRIREHTRRRSKRASGGPHRHSAQNRDRLGPAPCPAAHWGLSEDHEAQVLARASHFFHIENSSWAEWIFEMLSEGNWALLGMHAGMQNAFSFQTKRIEVQDITAPLEGIHILHIKPILTWI